MQNLMSIFGLEILLYISILMIKIELVSTSSQFEKYACSDNTFHYQ